MNILVIDIGGTHVKVGLSSQPKEKRKFDSSPKLTPEETVQGVKNLLQDWTFDAITIGYPGVVKDNKPAHEPHNLGVGWLGFDFAKAFSCPVKVINDAALQAIGNYNGGKMLFLGLGTGLGTTLIVDGTIIPMEAGHLPYKNDKSFEEYVGVNGLETRGKKKWRKSVIEVVQILKAAFVADDVVLGGGNSKKLKKLPEGTRLGDGMAAFTGGFRLWHTPLDNPPEQAAETSIASTDITRV